jgi:arylsulfatase A-like enzyme
VRVPFSITAPRRLAGGCQTVGHNVSLVDLFPTLCDVIDCFDHRPACRYGCRP